MRISPTGICSVPPTRVRIGSVMETPLFPPNRTTWKSSNSFFALHSVTLDLNGPGLLGVGLSVESRMPASVGPAPLAASGTVAASRTSKRRSLTSPPRVCALGPRSSSLLVREQSSCRTSQHRPAGWSTGERGPAVSGGGEEPRPALHQHGPHERQLISEPTGISLGGNPRMRGDVREVRAELEGPLEPDRHQCLLDASTTEAGKDRGPEEGGHS